LTVAILSFNIIILPVVLYGFGPWSLTLREESTLRIFEKRVLEKVIGRERGKVIGE